MSVHLFTSRVEVEVGGRYSSTAYTYMVAPIACLYYLTKTSRGKALSSPLGATNSSVSRSFAISVVETLRGHGHQAYLVGGCVRDLLLGREPTDYDVSTDAT